MKLHCPKCKSTDFVPIVETSTNSGYAVNSSISHHNSVSNIKLNSIHRDYWMCKECGTKFRNIQNLQEEIVNETKKSKQFVILSIVIALCAFLTLLMGAFSAFGPLLIILGILTGISWFISNNKVNNMHIELKYLEENCF